MADRTVSRQRRRKLLLELIQKDIISSQNQLRERLAQVGVPANQATLSRDLRELGIIKVPHEGGSSYVLASQEVGEQSRHERRLRELVVSVAHSDNTMVIKTPPGFAQACALAIDKLDPAGILGTVAGDDTIMVILDPQFPYIGTANQIRKMAGLPPL